MVLRIFALLVALISQQAIAQEQGALIKQPPAWPSARQHLGAAPATGVGEGRDSAVYTATPATAETDTAPIESPSGFSPASYTVQVAAFRKAEAASRAIEQNRGAGVQMIEAQRRGEIWYLLILGAYPTRQDAEQAAADYLQIHPEGSTWVRSTASIE